MAKTFNTQQVNLALCYIASAGDDLHRPPASELLSLINQSLADSPATTGQFNVVWGPAIYKLPLTVYDDNLMYVVQNTQNPNDYRVVIRATNPTSWFDWLVEDLWTAQTVDWSEYDPKSPSGASISRGTSVGVSVLQHMSVDPGLPGAGLTLVNFLTQLTTPGTINLTVTGHSLGGALSATLGLLLNDTLPSNFSVQVQASAGPTAGNAAFAAFSDQQLGSRLIRIHNAIDVVPHAWFTADLAEIPQLYQPQIKPPIEVTAAVGVAITLTKSKGYTQLTPDLSLAGTVNSDQPSYFDQLAYQHIDAYPLLLGMQPGDIVVAKASTFSPMHGTK